MTFSIQLARYRFSFILQEPMVLPFFSGSLLRGAFGHALRASSCVTGAKDCKTCPLYQSCLYTNIFEPPAKHHRLQKLSQAPGCYVVEPPPVGQQKLKAGETFSFDMVLWGKALEQLPLIIYAWQRAGQQGVGKNRTPLILTSVRLCGTEEQNIWQIQTPEVVPHNKILSEPVMQKNDSITLNFKTPLRLQHNGRPLNPDTFTPRALLMTLVRRISLVGDLHLNQTFFKDSRFLSLAADEVRMEHQLTWCDWQRFSSRQQQRMALGGVVGNVRLSGRIEPFREFLHLGQWLHIGKNASFGMGSYTLE